MESKNGFEFKCNGPEDEFKTFVIVCGVCVIISLGILIGSLFGCSFVCVVGFESKCNGPEDGFKTFVIVSGRSNSKGSSSSFKTFFFSVFLSLAFSSSNAVSLGLRVLLGFSEISILYNIK